MGRNSSSRQSKITLFAFMSLWAYPLSRVYSGVLIISWNTLVVDCFFQHPSFHDLVECKALSPLPVKLKCKRKRLFFRRNAEQKREVRVIAEAIYDHCLVKHFALQHSVSLQGWLHFFISFTTDYRTQYSANRTFPNVPDPMGSPEVLTIKDFANCGRFWFSSSINRSNILMKNWRIVVGNLWPLPFQFWKHDKFLSSAENFMFFKETVFLVACKVGGIVHTPMQAMLLASSCFSSLWIIDFWRSNKSVPAWYSVKSFSFFVVGNILFILRQNDSVYRHQFAKALLAFHMFFSAVTSVFSFPPCTF